jgi:pyruvate,orthophosphate dikinase
LLDPPLHEFLPEGDLDNIVHELAEETGVKEDEVLSRIEKLSEVNPMLGFRGCRFLTLFVSLCLFAPEEQSDDR